MTHVTITRAGPGITVQDLGRPGYIAQGLSRGGAADRIALFEGAALLGQTVTAALELPPVLLTLTVDAPTRIALTGTPMRAARNDGPLRWSASHRLQAGDTLTLSPQGGGFAYFTFGGGIDTALLMGSRATHRAAGIGSTLKDGDTLPLAEDTGTITDRTLDPAPRGTDAPLRLLPSAHTHLFDDATQARFTDTVFTRDTRGNRQGIRLTHEGAPFATAGQLSLLSEIARPGDIQMTGEGTPYILGPECQTTGGYPRIASILPADLPRAMQVATGAKLRFAFVTREEALTTYEDDAALLARLTKRTRPLTRDPRDMNLSDYQLISGVTDGDQP
ncbi:KipI antagonist [Rhodobacteraceae bacterium THAF1]|uniref:5-oxoprolinase subunit C family protein n=1 Tax=Palleronia sp. THAF1 TaxID=2587842 RepID=UPI000F3B41C6|nr:biotin-dependent carboxyltransferase family protein [Palleronia sp. THAF1]QFU07828.1 KipI antagonist [Palleronia sp. THAF1]VDC25646.1 KipI antagonist [Rhodobacteraceae bacterium THAF1]